MKNGNYINLTFSRGILLILLMLSPMVGLLADIKCTEDCNDHAHMKMSISRCCHSEKEGILVRTAQECAHELTFNVVEYRLSTITKSVKNVLFAEKNSIHIEETFPKFLVEDDLSKSFLSITAPAIYLLDSAFLI